jgi:hypothetical protein
MSRKLIMKKTRETREEDEGKRVKGERVKGALPF